MESGSLEYLIEYDIGHTSKDILDQIGIGGRGHMRINGSRFQIGFTLAQKSVDDEFRRILNIVETSVISGKSDSDALSTNFFLKQVFLVEEDDEGHFTEKSVVDNLLKEMKTVVQPIDAEKGAVMNCMDKEFGHFSEKCSE